MSGNPERQSREDALIARYIKPGEKHPISEATIGKTGPAVWRIVRFYHRVDGNLEEIEKYFNMQRPSIEAALAYYDKYKEFIDARILLEADTPSNKRDD